ncbi:MAG: hypothetical protein ACRDKS_01560 [Actinomycetota bacterium]
MEAMLERLEDVEDDLMTRAFLYDFPVAYREGVEAALEAVRAVLSRATAAA